jgi:hypothetical protein
MQEIKTLKKKFERKKQEIDNIIRKTRLVVDETLNYQT